MIGSRTNAKVAHAGGRNFSDRFRLERRISSTLATPEEATPRPRRSASADKVAMLDRATSLTPALLREQIWAPISPVNASLQSSEWLHGDSMAPGCSLSGTMNGSYWQFAARPAVSGSSPLSPDSDPRRRNNGRPTEVSISRIIEPMTPTWPNRATSTPSIPATVGRPSAMDISLNWPLRQV
jgi:hypothetical protein